ncbi:MAG: hypothetical protein ACI4UK_09590, partial [Floccifex sp.]
MKKKLLSILCAICTICMLIPMTIFAEGDITPTYDLWQVDGKIYYAEAGTQPNFTTEGKTELPIWTESHYYYW